MAAGLVMRMTSCDVAVAKCAGKDECLHDDGHHRDAAADAEQSAERPRRKSDEAEQGGALAGQWHAGILGLFKRPRRATTPYRPHYEIGHQDERGGAKDGLKCAALQLLNNVRAQSHPGEPRHGHDGGPSVFDALLSDIGDCGREGCHQHHRLRHAGDDAGRLIRQNDEQDGHGNEPATCADEGANCPGNKAEEGHQGEEEIVHGFTIARTAWGGEGVVYTVDHAEVGPRPVLGKRCGDI